MPGRDGRVYFGTDDESGSLFIGQEDVAIWKYGAEPTGERVVAQGKVVTAAGVSSGIDMGL